MKEQKYLGMQIEDDGLRNGPNCAEFHVIESFPLPG